MILVKRGDKGLDVRTAQGRLKMMGYKLTVDGWFGAQTEKIVLELQKRFGLVQDGIYGPKTDRAACGHSCAKLLKQDDIRQTADELGVDVASIMAINSVESVGIGFIFDQGKPKPKILFERHIFHRRLSALKGFDVVKLSKQYPMVINRSPGGYLGGSSEFMRLSVATDIDRDTGYESASWGLYQIMGFHWKILGYESAQDFVDKMNESETHHLDALKRFIIHEKSIHKALKEKKWATFARLYNGPNYKKNLYDVKIARAYERYKDFH